MQTVLNTASQAATLCLHAVWLTAYCTRAAYLGDMPASKWKRHGQSPWKAYRFFI